MRVVYFGARPIGERCLRLLLEQQAEIVAVGGGRNGGRGWWGEADTEGVARDHGIPVLAEPKEVAGLEYDRILSVYYDRILPPAVVRGGMLPAVNLHGAPLPEYRGRFSFLFAILNGEEEYGVSLHEMDEGVDTGDLIECRRFPIPESVTARELYDIALEHAFELFRDWLPRLLAGPVLSEPQGPGKYSYRSGDEPSGHIDLDWPRDYIVRYIRALTFPPFEPPWIDIVGRRAYVSLQQTETA